MCADVRTSRWLVAFVLPRNIQIVIHTLDASARRLQRRLPCIHCTCTPSHNPSFPLTTNMADALKDQGNKAFQAKDYDKAIDLFSQALELDPNNFVLWSNRSAAKAGKRQWADALEDAEQVCVLPGLLSRTPNR